jgi:hypothetical protein
MVRDEISFYDDDDSLLIHLLATKFGWYIGVSQMIV